MTEPASVGVTAPPSPARRDGARFAITVLTAMNLLNYVDRYVPSAVKTLFQEDLHLTDLETSVPLTAFIFVYMFASPLFGALADRWPRKVVIAAGVALWSLATGAAAFSTGFVSFLVARAFVGVGEAAYATLSPALLSDFYPPNLRSRALTFFYVAIPVGTAIGFAAGGAIGERYGWRAAFLVCGLPGVIAALFALRIKDPGRGTFDADAAERPTPWRAALVALRRNPTFVLAVIGYTAVTFAGGIMADWYATFLHRCRGATVEEAAKLAGIVIVLGGLAGTAFGGWLGERFVGRTKQPYLLMCGLTMFIAAVLCVPALLVEDPATATVWAALSQVFFWAYNGPLNAILVNCVPSALRARAFALSILCIHAFGDAISPSVAGAISGASGNLLHAMLLVPVAAAVGALVWLYGWRALPAAT